jgi:hypothetical protein
LDDPITIEAVGEMLDELAEEIPAAFFRELNGGVNLLPDTVTHPADEAGELYTLGEYRHDSMGRYIVLYHGSLTTAFPGYTPAQMRAQVKKTLLHEFTHHLESLAGEHGLEDKDARDLAAYKNRKNR